MDAISEKSSGGAQSVRLRARAYADVGKLPVVFPASTLLLLATSSWSWPLRWLFSGAGLLSYCLILADSNDSRVLSFIPLWTQLALINLVYALCATSWLFFWVFAVACYPAILLASLFQFERVAKLTRRQFGRVLTQLHFINDKVAFFDIPALEIDTEVEGLLVVRGVTFSLSRLIIVAHGVEVGIKLSEDMELSIQVDLVKVSLFRKIEIGDVYANLKGGEYEMTFGQLARRATGDSLVVSDTPLLEAAARRGNTTRPDLARLRSRLTNGADLFNVSPKAGLDSITHVSPGESSQKYNNALAYIDKTSAIQESIRTVQQAILDETNNSTLDPENQKALQAAVCSQLHDRPSVPHPPLRSVKVTTLQNLTDLRVKRFLHRLPFLLRLFLNPLAYFHPVHILSITAGGSGKWLQHMLHEKVFQHYGESDSGIRKLERRVSAWLADANFVLQLADIQATAQVPISTSFDIDAKIKIEDVVAYRTLPKEVDLTEVIRLGGADASISIPTFLLPHHEHLLPPPPGPNFSHSREEQIKAVDGLPNQRQKAAQLERELRDETCLRIAVHGRLPAVLNQQLLDFLAALVKAVKIIEAERDPDLPTPPPSDADTDRESIYSCPDELPLSPTSPLFATMSLPASAAAPPPPRRTVRELAAAVKSNVKDGLKSVNEGMRSMNEGVRRAGLEAIGNDRIIAKLVGRITRRLETAQGDVGYSGEVPVSLAPYRERAEEDLKLLP